MRRVLGKNTGTLESRSGITFSFRGYDGRIQHLYEKVLRWWSDDCGSIRYMDLLGWDWDNGWCFAFQECPRHRSFLLHRESSGTPVVFSQKPSTSVPPKITCFVAVWERGQEKEQVRFPWSFNDLFELYKMAGINKNKVVVSQRGLWWFKRQINFCSIQMGKFGDSESSLEIYTQSKTGGNHLHDPSPNQFSLHRTVGAVFYFLLLCSCYNFPHFNPRTFISRSDLNQLQKTQRALMPEFIFCHLPIYHERTVRSNFASVMWHGEFG